MASDAKGSRIKVSLIGAGSYGQRIVTTLLKHPSHFEIVAVYSRDPGKREPSASLRGLPIRPVGDFGKSGEELALIATPDHEHVEWLEKALDQGLFCYVEKPLAVAARELQRTLRRQSGLERVFVGHQMRRSPHFRKAKELVSSGKLGRLVNIRMNFSHGGVYGLGADSWRLSKSAHPEGPLSTLGSHSIDLLHDWLGPIETVYGIFGNYSGVGEPPDANLTCGRLRSHGGPTFVLQSNYCQPSEQSAIVTGVDGVVEVERKKVFLRLGRDSNKVPTARTLVYDGDASPGTDPLEEQLLEMHAAVRLNTPFATGFWAGADVVWALDAIIKSAQDGQPRNMRDYEHYFRDRE